MEIADPSRFRSAYKFPHQHRATGVLAPFREILEAKPIPFCLQISWTESWCRLDRSLKRKIPAAATHRPPHATVAGSPRLQPPSSRGPSPPLTDAGRPPGPVLLCSRCRRPRHVIPQVLAADCSQSQQKEIRKRNL